MTQPPDEPDYRHLEVNVPGSRGVGIGGNVTGSQIFTGDIYIQIPENVYAPAEATAYSQAQIYLSLSLQASLVRIYESSSSLRIVGVGFLVDKNHFVSCVHVIQKTLGLLDGEIPEASDEIHFDFPLLGSSQKLSAHVIHWDPANDFAGLMISEPLPEGAQPAILRANKDIWGDSYQTFGFPDGVDIGAWASGTIIGPQSKGQAQIKGDLERTGMGISLGFSGSPIWNTRMQAVVGMIRQVDITPSSTTASMLTIDAMQASWSLLHDTLQPLRPYRSLEIFRIEHAKFFFGRTAMIAKLREKLQEVDFLAIVGSSGSGKSSLVQGGLIPVLQSENPTITPIIFRPGTSPTKNLASALTDILEPDLSNIERLSKINLLLDLITSKSSAILDVITSLQRQQPEASFLLIIDQFEEIFASDILKQDQQQFLELLPLMTQQVQDVKIIITLRADFFGSVLSQPGLGRIVDEGQVNVLPMTHVELRDAIVEPVKLVGGSFEPELVEQIIKEVVDQPGNLPHLQFALAQLWDLRTSENLMTHVAYHGMGGVQGSIARRAEEEFLHLQSQGKGEIVRRILTRLVAPDEEGRNSRRRANRQEIETSKGSMENSAWQVVQVLTNSRLLVTDRDPITGEETVEVAHEALIRNWGRLREWVDSKREFYIWRQARLEPRLEDWEKRDNRFLDKEEVVAAKRWLVEQREELNPAEMELIFHSLLRAENADLTGWLPRLGTQEQVFEFLAPYWDASDTQNRVIGVRALASLPVAEEEDKILQKLQIFALEDPSLEVAIVATHGLCRRGQIERLVMIINRDSVEQKQQERLVKILASTRNMPQIGHQVLEKLSNYRRQVQIEAAILLLQQYRNELALTFVITFLVGLLGGILNSVVIQLLRQAYSSITGFDLIDPLNIFVFSIGSTEIMLVLILGLFATIQVRLIDQRPLLNNHFRPAILAVLFYTLLFILLSWAGILTRLSISSVPTMFVRDIPELLATLTFANVLVFGIFHSQLFLERKEIVEQSMSVASKATSHSLIISMGLGLLLMLGIGIASPFGFDLSSNGIPTYEMYFLSVSMSGFLTYLNNGLRIFIYLAGFYWGLQLAFPEPAVREKLSGSM